MNQDPLEALEQQNSELYGQIDALQKEKRELREKINNLESSNLDKDRGLKSQDQQLETLNKETADLKSQLQATKDDVEQQTREKESVNADLQRAYADLDAANAKADTSLNKADSLDAEYRGHQLKFAELHNQWEDERARVLELQASLEATQGLRDQISGLVEDVQQLTQRNDDMARSADVKDERINNLEKELQRALQGQLSAAAAAEAAAAAAASSMGEPQFITYNPNSSLQDELADLDGDFDVGVGDVASTYEHLSFIAITETINITPIEPVPVNFSLSAIHAAETAPIAPTPPKLTLSTLQAVSTEPVEPIVAPLALSTVRSVETTPIEPIVHPLAFSRIQAVSTEPIELVVPPLSTSTIKHIQTVPIDPVPHKLTLSSIKAVETSPIEPAERPLALSTIKSSDTAPVKPSKRTLALSTIQSVKTTPSALPTFVSSSVQTDIAVGEPHAKAKPRPLTFSAISSVDTTPSSPYKVDQPSASTSVNTTISSATQTLSPRTFPLTHKFGWLFLLFAFFGILTSLLSANLQYTDTPYGSSGAFGYPVKFLGIIPIGYDIGDSYWSEQLAKAAAISIRCIEEWLGVDRSFTY